MKNSDIKELLRYHQATKHSEISVRTSAHYLDWENRPAQFKTYEKLPSTPLPRVFPRPQADALQSIVGSKQQTKSESFGIDDVAELLFFSAGLTRRFRHGGEPHYMRAAPATGALYPIELYLVCEKIQGIDAGVYHFNPLDFSLVQIRLGDYRAELGAASEDSIAHAEVTVAFTSLAWRNAWKYEARSYRHWFWDGGVIAANFLAVLSSMGLEGKVVAGFVDETVNRLLGVDESKEQTVFLVAVEPGTPPDSWILKNLDRINPVVRPLSRGEEAYPEIWEAQRASSFSKIGEVRKWKERTPSKVSRTEPTGKIFSLSKASADIMPHRGLDQVILQRGSTRRFARVPVDFSQLSAILRTATTRMPLDYLSPGESLIDVYFIANEVNDLPPGSYYFDGAGDSVEQLKPGQLRRISAYLCLEQALFGDASAVLFLMADLARDLELFGNRGYRAAQLEGGIILGRIYLSAYAVGLGASGTTFYDDAVTEFFSPQAKEKSTMTAVGVGVPAYNARPGKVLAQLR